MKINNNFAIAIYWAFAFYFAIRFYMTMSHEFFTLCIIFFGMGLIFNKK